MSEWSDCAGLKAGLGEGQRVETELRAQVEASTEALTKTGKPYRQLLLRDGAASLMLRFWQDAPGYDFVTGLNGGEFVGVGGQWEDKGYGPEVAQTQLRELDEAEVEQLLAGDGQSLQVQQRAWTEVRRLVDSVAEPRLKAVLEAFLAEHEGAFRRAAAAANFHHARRGGLLEHVAQMMRSAEALCTVYTQLNRDLLLAGTFFHDCGKLWENPLPEHGFTQEPQFAGEMLGHIVIGIETVNSLWRRLQSAGGPAWDRHERVDHDRLRLHLLHLIGSHHGEHEWGSPVLPKTPEAVALHYIDNLDAKLEMLAQGYVTSPEVAPGIHAPVRPLRQRLIAPLGPAAESSPAMAAAAAPPSRAADQPTSAAKSAPAAEPAASAQDDELDSLPWEREELF